MAEEKKNETIETITKAYEEKIVELQKQHQNEIKIVKEDAEKEKQVAIQEIEEQHKKELADFILGRKQIEELEKDNKEKEKNEEKSFFDQAVERTKEKLSKGV